ncbi:MAG: excisionase family DNA-binding protein [Cellulomonadaceae bacterium]|jgi:excisionase family DNA binding protein|nr:excisionase family DNA-binding protein [Cellulomonadaceae bacterium]
MSQATITRNERPVLPPADFEAMLRVSTFLEQHPEPALLLGPDGQQVPLPLEVYEILVKVAAAMRAGQAVSVTPLSQRLTTQEAADLLGISRPTLVKLLSEHQIPYEQDGQRRHRRLRLCDVLEYAERRRIERRLRLDEMTRQAVDDDLYSMSATDYTAALTAARRDH